VSARHLNAVFSDPLAGREAEFEHWYETNHVADCLRRIEGYAAGQRFGLDPEIPGGQPAPWRHLALYELDTESLPRTYRSVEQFRRVGGYEPPAGRVAPGHTTWVYTPLGDAFAADVEAANRLCLCFTNRLNGWYDEHVLAEVAPGLPGFVSGARYARSAEQRLGVAPPWPNLAVYEFEAHGVAELLARRDFVALGSDHATWVFSPLSPRLTRAAAVASGHAGT
jgi:hypothetical protein